MESEGEASEGQASGPLKVVLLHQHLGPKDDYVAALLHEHLTRQGHEVVVDRSQTGTPDWAILVQRLIEEADAVVPLVSEDVSPLVSVANW